jgi:hypothetical protein
MTWFKKVMGLSFVPIDRVQQAYNILLNEQPETSIQLNSFTAYFEKEWLSNVAIWNHSESMGPRTNNHVEGYHSKLNKTLSSSQPKFIDMVVMFKNDESNNSLEYQQVCVPYYKSYREKKYVKRDDEIERLINSLNETNRIEDLRQFLNDISAYIGDFKI